MYVRACIISCQIKKIMFYFLFVYERLRISPCALLSYQDFDNDGLQELLITGDYGESKMFWNNGNMTFTECTRQCGLNADVVSVVVKPRNFSAPVPLTRICFFFF